MRHVVGIACDAGSRQAKAFNSWQVNNAGSFSEGLTTSVAYTGPVGHYCKYTRPLGWQWQEQR
jgi:hypothetical protein